LSVRLDVGVGLAVLSLAACLRWGWVARQVRAALAGEAGRVLPILAVTLAALAIVGLVVRAGWSSSPESGWFGLSAGLASGEALMLVLCFLLPAARVLTGGPWPGCYAHVRQPLGSHLRVVVRHPVINDAGP
jgi:hypothetical protein